jgi:hypothetical protein
LPPSEQESQDVAQVVSRVRDEGERMSNESKGRFEQNICGVQGDPDDERSAKIRRRMRMVGVRMGVFVSHGVFQVGKSLVVNGGFGKGCGTGRDLRSKTF